SPVTKTLRRTLGRVLFRLASKVHDPYTDQLNRMAAELREEIVRQSDRVLDRVVEFEIRSRRDIVYAGDQDAALESNVFARENLVGAQHFGRPKETLEYALSLAPQGGMALEFGVASGNTLRTIAG